MQNSLTKYVVSVEYLIAAILVAVFYINVGGFAWYWLPVTFFIFDISAIGYLLNNTYGALLYNAVHSLIGPTVLTLFYILVGSQPALLFVILVWLFHIFVDRALGFGLKHREGFHHTHLGIIGKAKRKSKTR